MGEDAAEFSVDQWFAALSRLTNVAVLMVDADCDVQFVSANARTMLGCDADADVGVCLKPIERELADLFDGVSCGVGGKPCGVDAFEKVYDVTTQDGRHRMAFHVYPIDVESCVGFLVLLRDLRVEELMAKDLRLASRYRNVSRMYQSMAHDLRAPVAAALMHLQVVRDSFDGADPADEKVQRRIKNVDAIHESVRHLEQSLSLLLDELTPADNPETELNLHDVITRAARIIDAQAQRQHVGVTLRFDGGEARISGAAVRIKQVLLNLMTNALEAMPDGGRLSISLAVDAEARQAVVRVVDNGHGIPDGVMPRIFDRYFTTKSVGTGIGLAVAKESIEAMGGTIEVQSHPGEGAAFTVRIPLHKTGG